MIEKEIAIVEKRPSLGLTAFFLALLLGGAGIVRADGASSLRVVDASA